MLCVSRSSPVCTRHSRSVPSSEHVYNCEQTIRHEQLSLSSPMTHAGLAHMWPLQAAWQQGNSQKAVAGHSAGITGSARSNLARFLWI